MFLYKITSRNLRAYEHNSVYFNKPRLVAYYEYNHGKTSNATRIKYFIKPKFDLYPMDLNVGFDKFVPRTFQMSSVFLELCLKYVMSSAEECDVENIEKTKVITRRGTLVHIMELLYNRPFEDVIIRVSRYNGSLYIVREEADESLLELKPLNTHHGQLEDFLFNDSPDTLPDINRPFDENIKLVGVHRSVFGKYDVIYSGEIQGIISNDKIEDFDDLDALNDCRFVLSKQMWMKLKHKDNKYLRFWLQSYLANVREIYIGYKNSEGIIQEPIERKMTKDLPENRFWKPSVCTGLLYDFLRNVEKCMRNVNCLRTVYAFSYNRDERSFNYEVFKGENSKTFLSKEYMEYYEKGSARVFNVKDMEKGRRKHKILN